MYSECLTKLLKSDQKSREKTQLCYLVALDDSLVTPDGHGLFATVALFGRHGHTGGTGSGVAEEGARVLTRVTATLSFLTTHLRTQNYNNKLTYEQSIILHLYSN